MKKMIIFLSFLAILFAQADYKSQAQIPQPTQLDQLILTGGVPNLDQIPDTNPTSYPDTGPIEEEPYPAPTSYSTDTGPIEAGSDPCKNKILCAGSSPGCCKTGTCMPTRSGWTCK